MRIRRLIALNLALLAVASCGGGGGGGEGGNVGNTPAPDPLPVVTISEVAGETTAIEKSGQVAKFQIIRSGSGEALTVGFSMSGNSDPAGGSATNGDFDLRYSDGSAVQGGALVLAADQNNLVIEVWPVEDSLHEVPEVATFSLAVGGGYTLGASTSAESRIVDATNTDADRKVFLGLFQPQGDAATTATGSASFILQGDNDAGMLSYNFSGLGSVQVDQHIHLTNGPILKDIEFTGPIFDFPWDLSLENGAPFSTEQELLDALFEGRVFVNVHTAEYLAGEISVVLVYDAAITAPPTTALTSDEVDRDIIRFLNQATFGATPETYTELRQKIEPDGSNRMVVYSDWIEAQLQQPVTEFMPFVDAQLPLFLDATGDEENGHTVRKDSFWAVATFAKDQLRQRFAYALSQILVVSEENADVRNAYRGTADYYDTLARHSTSTYRELIEEVSRHSVMGAYLSHLRNEKEDPTIGYFPDENYAREVMQLFTFGLVARNPDGTIKLGANNLPIETYDNTVIREMAQVFTGLSFGSRVSSGSIVTNNNFTLNNSFNNGFQYRWTEPMRFFNNRHDTTEKVLFTDDGVQLVIPAGMQPNDELGLVLDALVAHSGTAPYVVERLIQRFVTSNPSPDYIERVAGAFGETGDMAAVIRAILLDEEARNPVVMSDPQFGKFKEPVLQITAILRLHEAYSSVVIGSNTGGRSEVYALGYANADSFEEGAMLLRMGSLSIGQEALNSPSVFNFYSPNFAPTGSLSNNGLVAPELELVTETQIYQSFNIYNSLIRDGRRRNNRYTREATFINQEQLRVRLSDARVRAVWDNTAGDNDTKAAAVVEFLDFYINAGRLHYLGDSETQSSLTEALAVSDIESGEMFELAAYGSALLPEFMVQK